MSISRSAPASWMLRANSTCLSDRLPWVLSRSSLDRMSSEFSGVRSSWLMLARNSDLYLEVSASCSAFSSSAWRACSTSLFLRSTSWFWWARRRALSCSSWLVCCSSSCRLPSSDASDWDCLSRSSVRVLASMVLMTMPMDSVSWSRKASCTGLKWSSEASSSTPRTWSSKTMGSTSTSIAAWSERPEAMRKASLGVLVSRIFDFSIAHCPTRPSPSATSLPCALCPPEA